MENIYLCLSDLLDQDLSSYEFFHSLPKEIQSELHNREITTFGELQSAAAELRVQKPQEPLGGEVIS